MISASYIHALSRYANSLGLNTQSYLSQHDNELHSSDALEGNISCTAFVALMEAMAHDAADEAFGIHFIESLPPRPAGVFNHIIFNSRSLKDAFQAIARFQGLVTDAFQIRYEESGNAGWLVYDCPVCLGPHSKFLDGQIALIAVRARHLLGENCLPVQVDMVRPEPNVKNEFRRVFGVLPHFSQPVNRIGYDSATLARPLPSANHELFLSAQDYASRLLGLEKGDQTFSAQVTSFIASALQRGTATELQACTELGVSVRTLQRNLASEGTSFKAMMEETRMHLARHYLNNTDLSLTAIAFLLGYSELSAFSRAAKNWLGESPSAMRKRQRTGAV